MNQKSRKYNKRVEIWKVTQVSDGFGGQTTQKALDKEVWMHISSNISGRAIEQGITDALTTLKFEQRYRTGIDIQDTFFKYKGQEYVLQSVDNVNEMNTELVCYASKSN